MTLQSFMLFLTCLFITSCESHPICDDKTVYLGLQGPRNKNDMGRYYLQIPGNPTTYTPEQVYNISLKARLHRSFKHFLISVEPSRYNTESNVGNLDLGRGTESEMLAKFSEHCPYTIIEATGVQKAEIQVFWTAPPKNSGCIQIRAIVVEAKDNWFGQDNGLTRELCEDTGVDEDVKPKVLDYCCACQEAKYEVAFEGRWIRNTHPRHFPSDQWNTGFSDVIGASHRLNQAFWEHGMYASEGLKKLADTGETDVLEYELKNNSERIRTIIKARGLQFPNITKSTYAVFRVDSVNHLVSLVSKIIPSPDWVVGVSNFELCRPDCTWEEHRTLKLYPWDIGIDDGLGYTTKVPTQRIQPITKITANYPNHPDNPFYSEDGEVMKPIARLHLTRQRLYDTRKECNRNAKVQSDNCATTQWRRWSPCSSRCGKGYRFRERYFLEEESKTLSCEDPLVEYEQCYGEVCGEIPDVQEEGETTEGTTEATPEEPGHEDNPESEDEDPNCPGTAWGAWTECSVTCGRGKRKRMRTRKNGFRMLNEDMQECFKPQIEECVVEDCNNEKQPEEEESTWRNIDSGSYVIHQGPDGKVINCKVSSWDKWSECKVDNDNGCGDGFKMKSRRILRHPQNGGRACPRELIKKKQCRVPCVSPGTKKCIMGPWSNWTPCTSNCGVSAEQIRTRHIFYTPPGVVCKEKREERRPCRLPLACTDSGEPIYQ